MALIKIIRKATLINGLQPCQVLKMGTYQVSTGMVVLHYDDRPWFIQPAIADELEAAGAVRFIKPEDNPTTFVNK